MRTHHQLRARVFSDRFGWDVHVTGDYESDGFDALKPTYILAVSHAGQVVGCARLLPALGSTMLTGVFPSLLPSEGLQAHTAMIESSRFCVDTSIEEGRGGGSVHQQRSSRSPASSNGVSRTASPKSSRLLICGSNGSSPGSDGRFSALANPRRSA